MNADLGPSPREIYSGQADFINGRDATEQGPKKDQSIASGRLRIKKGKSWYVGLGDRVALLDDHVRLFCYYECIY